MLKRRELTTKEKKEQYKLIDKEVDDLLNLEENKFMNDIYLKDALKKYLKEVQVDEFNKTVALKSDYNDYSKNKKWNDNIIYIKSFISRLRNEKYKNNYMRTECINRAIQYKLEYIPLEFKYTPEEYMDYIKIRYKAMCEMLYQEICRREVHDTDVRYWFKELYYTKKDIPALAKQLVLEREQQLNKYRDDKYSIIDYESIKEDSEKYNPDDKSKDEKLNDLETALSKYIDDKYLDIDYLRNENEFYTDDIPIESNGDWENISNNLKPTI